MIRHFWNLHFWTLHFWILHFWILQSWILHSWILHSWIYVIRYTKWVAPYQEVLRQFPCLLQGSSKEGTHLPCRSLFAMYYEVIPKVHPLLFQDDSIYGAWGYSAKTSIYRILSLKFLDQPEGLEGPFTLEYWTTKLNPKYYWKLYPAMKLFFFPLKLSDGRWWPRKNFRKISNMLYRMYWPILLWADLD
jgi:hypothetical protein